jgi:hypothetical protein
MGDRRPAREQIAWRRAQTEAMLAFSRVHQQILLATALRLEEAGIERITPARANALIVLFNARRPIQAQQLAVRDEQIASLEEWVKMGAPDPRAGARALTKIEQHLAAAKVHWAFQPVVDPKPGALDDLVGTTSAAPADRRTLIRRASLDLIGVPPSFAEVQAFEADAAPQAFERLLDRLLAGSRDFDAMRPDVWKLAHPEAVRIYRQDERRHRAEVKSAKRAKRRAGRR